MLLSARGGFSRGLSIRYFRCPGWPTSQSSSSSLSLPPALHHSLAAVKQTTSSSGYLGALAVAGSAASSIALGLIAANSPVLNPETDEEHIINWSGTHEVLTNVYKVPDSLQELENIIKVAHEQGEKLRVVGTALSPNGIALSSKGMLSMACCDRIVDIDPENLTVRVEAGARVKDVVDAIRPHGMTLQNYASIAEQQIGGFISVSAHGTGASIPPVDDQVVDFKLVTPAFGTIDVNRETSPELFRMARVGLGALGVISEVTLRCVPNHKLLEHTFVQTRKDTRKNHVEMLKRFKHVRYMWIPYTDAVVVVGSNPCDWNFKPPNIDLASGSSPQNSLEPLQNLLMKSLPHSISKADVKAMNFADLRDHLLSIDTLSVDRVIEVNNAEAEFWKRSEGSRVAESLDILQFECGGSQWVYEVCFPCGTTEYPSLADIDYMDDLLASLEAERVPAPAPIEQRWTSTSTSMMSPASSAEPDTLHSWVGIIMYMPCEDEDSRRAITSAFKDYCRLEGKQMDKYNAHVHWAKIEPPQEKGELAKMQQRLKCRYPVVQFNMLREIFDPKRVLSNTMIDKLFATEDE